MNPMNQIVQELVLKYNDPDKEDFVEAFNLLDRVSGENVSLKFNSTNYKQERHVVKILCQTFLNYIRPVCENCGKSLLNNWLISGVQTFFKTTNRYVLLNVPEKS